jgi:triosephosphate isomerase (TIM)
VKDPRRPLMAGNWKMNVNHLEAIALVQKLAFALNDADYEAVDVVVLPPFTDLRSVQTLIDGDGYRVAYGAQDISVHDAGAFTGEISGAMLAKLGCSYVLVGHSERREYHHETDEVVADKLRSAQRHGLVPILCVGEGLDVRREGRQVEHVVAQVEAAVSGLPAEGLANLVIAYEPVWAIGTGEVATPADAQEVCGAIRAKMAELSEGTDDALRILYGGSVKVSSVAGIMAEPDVDGCLVGGASLDPDEFVGIVRHRLLDAGDQG